MIHVCYGLHDKDGTYSKFTGTSICSMFENYTGGGQIIVNILHDNTLTEDNRDKFIYIAGRYNQQIKFYNVEKICADKISEMRRLIPAIENTHVSVGALYRLLIIHVLTRDVKKIIYLDSDIIVNMDIGELWRIELEDKPLAAVPEKNDIFRDSLVSNICRNGFAKEEDYFNSGVLLMNLEILCKEEGHLKEGIKWRAEHTECVCFDQDILNYCFSSRAIKLPMKFNCWVTDFQSHGIQKIGRNIYHYLNRGFRLNMQDNYNRLFMKYFIQTPFFDEETIGRLYEGVRNLYVEQRAFATYMTAIMSGKTRIFFVSSHTLEGVKNIFGVQDNEEIILAENDESIKKLIESANKKVIFISPDIYQQCREILLQAGLIENRDFINIINFLSDIHGVPLNSYQLIKLM